MGVAVINPIQPGSREVAARVIAMQGQNHLRENEPGAQQFFKEIKHLRRKGAAVQYAANSVTTGPSVARAKRSIGWTAGPFCRLP